MAGTGSACGAAFRRRTAIRGTPAFWWRKPAQHLMTVAAEAVRDRTREGRQDLRVAALRHVEAHECRRGLRRAEYIAGRQHDILRERRARHSGGVAAVGQAAPEIEAAAWHQPW